MDPTYTDGSFQDSPGKYLEESRPRNRSKTTWTSPRGASRRPDSNRRAWPQAPGAGGRGVPKTLVGLWLSLLFVDRSRAFACSLHRPDVRPTRVSATTSKRQQQREELQRKAARAQARESVAMYTPRGGGGVSAASSGASPQRQPHLSLRESHDSPAPRCVPCRVPCRALTTFDVACARSSRRHALLGFSPAAFDRACGSKMMRLPIAVSFRLLVLLALGERAAANLVLNPYTERGVPPPGRIPCMTDDDCKASAFCGPTDAERSSASCPTDQSEDLQPDGKYSCIEWWIVPGTHGTPTNACDNPKANGFEDCWSDVAQAERGSDERLKRFCSPRNRDGGMYWNSELPPPPPSPPPRSPPPSTPPPDFSNTTEGQLTYGSGALIFLLVIGLVRALAAPRRRHLPLPSRCRRRPPAALPLPLPLPPRCPHTALTLPSCRPPAAPRCPPAAGLEQVSYLVHVRAKVDAQRISQWASREGTGGPMRKGVGAAVRSDACSPHTAPSDACALALSLRTPRAHCSCTPPTHCAQLTFFIRWICLEAGLEVVVECFNGLASANATLGSPTSFYITCIINLAMILLETSEVCLTRKHGGKQTPWDCFLFGQVSQGVTPHAMHARLCALVLACAH